MENSCFAMFVEFSINYGESLGAVHDLLAIL
jgi:hypothetical protein